MSKETILFIGGPKDGKWMPVKDSRSLVEVAEIGVDADPWRIRPAEDSPTAIHHTYTRRRFMSGMVESTIFAHSSISDDELMGVLINGYKKP